MKIIKYGHVWLLFIMANTGVIASGKFPVIDKPAEAGMISPRYFSRPVQSQMHLVLPKIYGEQGMHENSMHTPDQKKSPQATPSDLTSEDSLHSNLAMNLSFDSHDTNQNSMVSYKSSTTTKLFNGLLEKDLVQGSHIMLKKGLVPLELSNSLAENSLHVAARNNSYKMINFLIKKDRLDINQKNLKEQTPLCIATKARHYDAIHELIELGADLNAQDAVGRTALHWACDDAGIVSKTRTQAGDKIVNLLITVDRSIPAENKKNKIISFEAQDPYTYTNLDIKDVDGRVPLHLAVLSKRYLALQELAEWGALLDVHDNNGYTPLHLAALQGDARAVGILLQAGADQDLINHEYKTPVQCVATPEIIALFAQHKQLRG